MFMDEQLKLLGEFGMTVRQGDVRPPPSPSPPTSAITPLLRSSSMTVKEKPRGNTVELVNHADPNAAMVLVNYIFLEGECLAWDSERKNFTSEPSGCCCPGPATCVEEAALRLLGEGGGSMGAKSLPCL